MRLSRHLPIGAAVVAGAAVAIGMGLTGGSGPEVANLWVDADGGSCSRQAPAAEFSDEAACKSLDAAYQAASPGDLVVVRAGRYPAQTIREKDEAAAPPVLVRPDRGSVPVLESLTIKASNLTIRGPMAMSRLAVDADGNRTANRPVKETVVEDVKVDGAGVDGVPVAYVRGVDGMTWRGVDVCCNNNFSLVLTDQDPAAGGLHRVTFDRSAFHDARLDAGSAAHSECLFAQGIDRLTITRSRFYRCAVMDVFVTSSGDGGDAVGGFVENNVFEAPMAAGNVCCSDSAFQFRTGGEPQPDLDGWDFRYNLFNAGAGFGDGGNVVRAGGLRVVGNVFLGGAACREAPAVYRYNFHAGGPTCGGEGERSGSSAAVKRATIGPTAEVGPGNGWLPSRGSPLVDAGDPDDTPPVDLEGVRRGARPDLGPREATARE